MEQGEDRYRAQRTEFLSHSGGGIGPLLVSSDGGR